MAFDEKRARDELKKLSDTYNALSAAERLKRSEEDVKQHFIVPLLRDVLGWPMNDPARVSYELYAPGGREDITLTLPSGEKLIVEAKRFGLIRELDASQHTASGVVKPDQLAMPGFINDRTDDERQTINYAFKRGTKWAILTSFERLRLFNAQYDWMVFSFERPGAYQDGLDLLVSLTYENLTRGSLEVLNRERLTAAVDTKYLAFINHWRKRLAQNIVDRREQNPWAFKASGEIDLPKLRAVVQRYLDRLVIVRYAEDRLVIDSDRLRSLFQAARHNPYSILDNTLRDFFVKFDEIHNSALFARGEVDKASFSQEVLVELLGKLYEARYRSMTPDIMGNTYEQYLGKTLVLRDGKVDTGDNLETRKKQGSYYTPQVIVRYIVDHSLGRYLYATENGRSDGTPIPGETRKTSRDIIDLRVLDSACGSGSFLIYAYEVLAEFYEAERERLNAERSARYAELYADPTLDALTIEIRLTDYKRELERISGYPRLILESHLYGVDLDPQAAEIAVVNLMMRGMQRQQTDQRLPLLLNQNIKVGNGLVGLRADEMTRSEHAPARATIRKLRAELIATPHGERHDAIIRELETATRTLNAELDPLLADHFTDLAAVRPFHWGVEFPEVFFDADGQPLPNPGFTIIVGNPPWEILKPDLREFYAQFDERIESQFTRAKAESRIAELDAEAPERRAIFEQTNAVIEETSAYVRTSGAYRRQGRGDVATHKLFLERMYSLLRREGRIGYIVPSGIYTDLGTKDLREMLLNDGNIQYIYSFSNERFFFPGVDHRFKFALIGAQKGQQADGFWSVFRFNPRVAVAPPDLPAFLANQKNLIYVRRESLAKFSPDSLSVMEFQSLTDYQIDEKIYRQYPTLGTFVAGCWNVKFTREFDKTNDRALFNFTGHGLPVYEGENLGFYGANLRQPTIWIDEARGRENLLNSLRRQAPNLPVEKIPLDYEYFRFGFRRIASATNERTLYVSYLPKRSFSMYTLTTTIQHFFDGTQFTPYMTKPQEMFLYACMASLTLDFSLRFQVSSSVAMFNVYSLPVPRLTTGNPYFDAIVPRAARLTCTRPEFADLWQSVMGEAWDESKGARAESERQTLRDEIDSIVAHLYGLTREEFDHILGTFPLVFPATDLGLAKRAALLATYERMKPMN